MMLAVSPAAGWQTSLSIRPHYEEWGDKRKAKNSQQEDGEKFTQWFD